MKYWQEEQNRAAFEYAKTATAAYSKSFYISAKMLPKEKRWATFALYGFCRFVDNLIDNPRDRSQFEILQEINYFENELRIAYKREESEHPVIRSFILVAQKYNIPIEYPLDLIAGVKMDMGINRYKSFDDLYIFCYRVASVVGLMMTHVMGYKDKTTFKYAEKLGIAMQLTNILRDIKEDKDNGRIYLPQDELEQFSVSEWHIMNEIITPEFQEMIRFQVERAAQYYEKAQPGIEMLSRDSQFAIYSASKIYRGILSKVEGQAYNPFIGRVFVPKSKKLAILFKELFRTKILTTEGELAPANP
jgi:15-cis-phytoene synthase